jgi:class 3 adenylate cyclase
VIGQRKHQYDPWGDTVNIANWMESGGAAGRIQITRETFELI